MSDSSSTTPLPPLSADVKAPTAAAASSGSAAQPRYAEPRQLSLLTGRPYVDASKPKSSAALNVVIPLPPAESRRHNDAWFAGTAAEFWDCCGTRWECINAFPAYLKCAPLSPLRTTLHSLAFPFKLVLAFVLAAIGLLSDVGVRLVGVLTCCWCGTEDISCCGHACSYQFPGMKVQSVVSLSHACRVCCCTTVVRGRETDCLPGGECCPAPRVLADGERVGEDVALSNI